MKKERCFESCLKENEERRHSKLDLESSTQVVSQDKQQRQAWKTLNQVQGDDLVCYNNNAFTLIELLVVVLIIGILAAVALPQYQKAVIKSRYATLKDLAHNIANAQEIYYLANGKYATDFEELSIDMPAGKKDTSTANQYKYDWGNCRLAAQQVMCQNSAIKMQYQMYLQNAAAPGVRQCVSFVTVLSAQQSQVCSNETGRSGDCTSGSYCIYGY